MAASREEKNHARRVVRHLAKHYADAECALNYESPFQLLIATILSAQCTDERVNIVTADLFAKYPTAYDLAQATQKQVEKIVKSAGFYRAKAKNIRNCAKQLMEKHDGEIPLELEALTALPGVGRKTGNVLLGTAFGIPSGVVVDTHVGRISRRLGIAFEKDPVKVERELMAVLPKKEWIYYSHRMIHHGRAICDARKPLCEDCSMKRFCPRIGVK
ncbi:MAG: endonuclease III [Rhodopirellula sp.]|nr:endonuclease III [Rhodopirellula sp.]|tara:strand:- start:3421 stop:4068 length:648 start_codon:yes stop_codon:yes gene_type:complete